MNKPSSTPQSTRIHILGICGTFMGSLAVLAKQLGYDVSGCDDNVYPPMSTQLEAQGIRLQPGYNPAHLQPHPDIVIVGNAMSRGNPCVEYMLNNGLNYTSGPQWLCDYVLQDRWVLAVAGTHGKTTTTTMLAWILQCAGLKPGYLIGGVPNDFTASADLGDKPFFVIEADEYDSAFFDKRSKFIHYRPRTVILNNLEFDHADIFDSIADIQKQFHHLVRTIPSSGKIIFPEDDRYLREVLQKGCWSEKESLSLKKHPAESNNSGWFAELKKADGSVFDVYLDNKKQGEVSWQQTGEHNINNALAAIAAARHVGVSPEHSIQALNQFSGVKRRMEKIFERRNVTVYDDFAHHPTAIKTTLSGLRHKVGGEKIIAVIEPRSNTMRMGMHKASLAASAEDADEVIWYQPANVDWQLDSVTAVADNKTSVSSDIGDIVTRLSDYVKSSETSLIAIKQNVHIVFMSNGGFGGIHQKLISALAEY
jgi:UDP-N-acetylmuramate: L-alanyl-gamma-D-glutamyl-meso-diaminopimelate ligase